MSGLGSTPATVGPGSYGTYFNQVDPSPHPSRSPVRPLLRLGRPCLPRRSRLPLRLLQQHRLHLRRRPGPLPRAYLVIQMAIPKPQTTAVSRWA